MNRLENKVALVTGGASGLGKAIAARLSNDGAHIVVSDIRDEPDGLSASAIEYFKHDVTDENRWPEVISAIERAHGRLDILVNSAGIIGSLEEANPENTSYAEWKRMFSVNVDGVFLGCRAAIPAMRRAGGGAIINISSVAGLLPSSQGMAYGASKATVRHMSKAVAQYGAPWNIRCNSVHPGHLRTSMGDDVAASLASLRGQSMEESYQRIVAGTPLGRLVTPEEVAAGVAYLVSDEAALISGTKLVIDGGVIYCRSYTPPTPETQPASSR